MQENFTRSSFCGSQSNNKVCCENNELSKTTYENISDKMRFYRFGIYIHMSMYLYIYYFYLKEATNRIAYNGIVQIQVKVYSFIIYYNGVFDTF